MSSETQNDDPERDPRRRQPDRLGVHVVTSDTEVEVKTEGQTALLKVMTADPVTLAGAPLDLAALLLRMQFLLTGTADSEGGEVD